MGNCNSSRYNVDEKNESSELIVNGGNPIHQGSILGLTVYQDNIITASDDHTIAVSNRSKLNSEREYKPLLLSGHTKAVNRVITHNNFIWSISRDLSVRQWSLEGNAVQTMENAHSLNLAAIVAHPSNTTQIFTGSRDYTVKGWDIETGKAVTEFKAPRNIVTTMGFSPNDPNLLYQGSEDLCIRVWDIRCSSNNNSGNNNHNNNNSNSGSQPAMLIGGYVYFPLCMDFHRDGNILATGCKGFDSVGCEVKVLDLRRIQSTSSSSGFTTSSTVNIISSSDSGGHFINDYKGHSHDVTSVKFSYHPIFGDVLFSCSKDGSLYARSVKHYGSAVVGASTAAVPSTVNNAKSSVGNSGSETSYLTGKNLTCMDVFDRNTSTTPTATSTTHCGNSITDNNSSNSSCSSSRSSVVDKSSCSVVCGATDGSLTFMSLSSVHGTSNSDGIHGMELKVQYTTREFFDPNGDGGEE